MPPPSAVRPTSSSVRSHDRGATWKQPVTVGTGEGDQFQPSLAVTRERLYVSFLDLLDLAGRSPTSWLASSRDGGRTWSEQRLSHDSWDPADHRRAVRSPTA